MTAGSLGGGIKSRRIVMKIQLTHSYEDIICLENLFFAWKEFQNGKRNKKDVQEFSMYLMDNIFSLHSDLSNHTYIHGGYQAFKINDPKPRDIHKATVRDRLLHHAIYRILYPFFDRTFIADSYSCRNGKGTHRAINKFRSYFYKVSQNNIRTCWVLKCDIKKFFANINHEILTGILREYIPDENIMRLLENVVGSFFSPPSPQPSPQPPALPAGRSPDYRRGGNSKIGLPLGNFTSQLFVNIYMNKFDQFIKHKLKAKYYIRYCDDFAILSEDKKWLENMIPEIRIFLREKLKLELHPNKISIKTFFSGVDFLGMVDFSEHRILRTKTKRRMIRGVIQNRDDLRAGLISEKEYNQALQSYLGILKHCRGYEIGRKLAMFHALD
jgi:RNA-directed DNA polymerase